MLYQLSSVRGGTGSWGVTSMWNQERSCPYIYCLPMFQLYNLPVPGSSIPHRRHVIVALLDVTNPTNSWSGLFSESLSGQFSNSRSNLFSDSWSILSTYSPSDYWSGVSPTLSPKYPPTLTTTYSPTLTPKYPPTLSPASSPTFSLTQPLLWTSLPLIQIY